MVREDRLQLANGRILKADPGIMPEAWKTIVPEANDVIEIFSIVGGKIYVKRLNDVKSETSVYTLDGKPAGTVAFDGIGSASAVVRPHDRPLWLFQLRVLHSAADAFIGSTR